MNMTKFSFQNQIHTHYIHSVVVQDFVSGQGPGWLNELGLYELLGNPTIYHQYGMGSCPAW